MRLDLNQKILNKLCLKKRDLEELLAIAVYQSKGIGSGLAGELIGITGRDEFHRVLGKWGVQVNYDSDDLAVDINNLKKLKK